MSKGRPPKPPDVASAPRQRGRGADKIKSEAPTRTIHTLIREAPSRLEFDQVDKEALQIHSRSAAILLAAHIEFSLEYAILIRLKRNDEKTVKLLVDRDGPLSGFYAKIQLAYALGVFESDALYDLNIIRRVRNAFAHSPRPIDFTTEEIKKECLLLRCVKDMEIPEIKPNPEYTSDPIRRRFTLACRILADDIVLASVS